MPTIFMAKRILLRTGISSLISELLVATVTVMDTLPPKTQGMFTIGNVQKTWEDASIYMNVQFVKKPG